MKHRKPRRFPIPCRHCGKWIRVEVRQESFTLKCPACDRDTRVEAHYETGEIRIRTEGA